MRAIAAAAVVVVALVTAAPVRADEPLLDQAQRAIDDIDYEAARRLVSQAVASGDLDAASLRRAYRLLGESAAALGDGAAARDAFTRWLVLEPDASLGAGVSPRIAEPFAVARTAAAKLGRFAAEVRVTRDADRIELVVVGADPFAMVAGLKVRVGDASEVSIAELRAVLPAPAASAVDVTVVLVDRAGNELARTVDRGAVAPAAAVPGPPPPPVVTRRSRRWPTLVRWPTWTGLAVVAAGAGGYFAWQLGKTEDELDALNAASGEHSFDEALALTERGDRQALLANVGFGVAGVAAVAAVLTLVLEPTGTVEVAPTAGGATATATVRF